MLSLSKILDNVESFIDIETAIAYDFVTGSTLKQFYKYGQKLAKLNQIK